MNAKVITISKLQLRFMILWSALRKLEDEHAPGRERETVRRMIAGCMRDIRELER